MSKQFIVFITLILCIQSDNLKNKNMIEKSDVLGTSDELHSIQ
jgi:hypothetical protein